MIRSIGADTTGYNVYGVYLTAIAVMGSTFIVVADADPQYNIMMSTDNGQTWTYGPSMDGSTDIACSGTTMVTIYYDVIRYSTDMGTTWTASGPPLTEWYHIAWVNNKFVATGQSNETYRAISAISDDGITWQVSPIDEVDGYNGDHTEVVYGKGIYVAGGKDRTIWSADGLVWNKVTGFVFPETAQGDTAQLTFNAIAYSEEQSKFIGVGEFRIYLQGGGIEYGPFYARSTDGKSWIFTREEPVSCLQSRRSRILWATPVPPFKPPIINASFYGNTGFLIANSPDWLPGTST